MSVKITVFEAVTENILAFEGQFHRKDRAFLRVSSNTCLIYKTSQSLQMLASWSHLEDL